jgi:SAM-dependent methyltransferase
VPNKAALIDYYAKRAKEYERIYEKPERQKDLAALKELCRKMFAGHKVLEIACGTGYWTQIISQTANSITASDINDEVLQIAKAKSYGCEVRFQRADAFDLAFSKNDFSAGLAVFWWSHLRKSEIRNFLARFHRQFASGTLIVFMDNQFVPGSSTPISRTDCEGNTYQLRRLENGTEHEILKNFPTEREVRNVLDDAAVEFCWTALAHYWLLTYRLQ